MVRIASRIAAVVGPLLVLLGAYRGLMGYHDLEEATAAMNAGRVFNAKVLDGGAASAMDQLLAERAPEVVVLGPSYANTDVDPVRLANQLGLPRESVVLLSVPNSIGPHWYAMLKYRVFDKGYRPRLILVVSGLQSMLLDTPLTESSFVNLEVQLPEGGDPLISRKVQHDSGLVWARLREQRGKVRAAWFDWLRDAPMAWFGLNPLQVRVALGRVFDDEHVDMRLHGASTPVVEANRGPERVYDATMLPSPEQSFLGDTTALATEHGARIVWIRPPMSPFIPKELDDVVLPGVQEAATALVEREGGSLVDLRSLRMTEEMFRNEDHMNDEGSRMFSERLGRALREVDALAPGIPRGGLPALAPAVSGADAGVVAPGRTARWQLDGWPEVRGAWVLDLLVAREGGLDGVTATVAGKPVWLRAEPGVGRVRGVGHLEGAAPDGPFAIEVTAPPGGAPVEVRALGLGRGQRRAWLMGDAAAFAGHAVDLVAVAPEHQREPVRVPGWNRPVSDRPGPLAGYDTERWAFLSDGALEIQTGRACSPFRVVEDGAPLPLPNVPCAEVAREGHGRMCHDGDQILFTSPDGTDPGRTGRDHRIVLDPARRCGALPWLYPLDHAVWRLPADALAPLSEGAGWLVLEGKYLNFREAALAVQVRVDGEVVLDAGVDGRELKQGPKAWRLDPPIPPTAGRVEVSLESRGFVFYLLDRLALAERPPP
ncbi:MAG: hypothetical protein R3F59_04380 [Myxococcota bacterium]